MSGRRRGRRQGWEKEKKRETGMGEKDRKRGKSGRETGVGERERYKGERERDTERGRDSGEREGEKEKKITNTKKFMEFYLVVLHSAERSEARQWIVARQVSCYNPLPCFNPVTIFNIAYNTLH